jgi:hypothetical protein
MPPSSRSIGLRWLVLLLALASVPRTVQAGCNLIPGTEKTFNGTLGATTGRTLGGARCSRCGSGLATPRRRDFSSTARTRS